jgi:hypothetical protein
MSRIASLWLFIRSSLLAVAMFIGRTLLVLGAIVPSAIDRRLDRRRRARLTPLPRRARPRVLFIGGTINHTTQVRQIAAELPDCDHAFTWYYGNGFLEFLRRAGRLENTAMGDKLRARCLAHMKQHNLPLDLGGERGPYDLAITCSDLSIPRNVRGRPLVLVQEGMTDREDMIFRMVKAMRLPPWVTVDSSGTGLSHAYDRFCVASEGYRTLFERKGVPPDKLVVTGIPNFDNCDRFLQNDFPHRGYVLVCSSDIRETLRWENRARFIRQVLRIAAGRQIIWKLHPNEKAARARHELAAVAPGALVFESGNAEEMIANCDVLVTQFSSTAYVGLALGKEVHSYFDVDELRRLCPVQNGRTSAWRIANVCRELLGLPVNRQLPDGRADGATGTRLSV